MGLESNSLYTALGTATTATVKGKPGRVFQVVVVNRNASARYFQFYDTTSATTPIKWQFLVPAGDQIGVGTDIFGDNGAQFSTGITWGMSTTAGSYVAATASETDVTIRWR